MPEKYGHAHRKARAKWAEVVARGEAECCEIVCLKPSRHIDPDEEWHLAHTADGLDYLGPAHAECNTSEGAIRGNQGRAFLVGADAPPRPCLSSLSPEERLAWDPDYLRGFAWLSDLADVPEDASPPLMMSPVPDDAVCSYGWSGCTHTTGPAVAWIEQQFRCKLRWWQRLSTVRQLEHREDGTLCFGKKVESAPRRSGKSYGMRGVTVWRMEFGAELFGEVQTVIHTGSDVAICREIQRGAWRWAESREWTVTRGNGKEAIETPTGGRWMVKAQDAVYGYDVCLGLVDEGWDVKPDTVNEGLEPAALERQSAQVSLTSTAHRRATSMMRSEIAAAMSMEDPETLLLLWAAPAGSDPSSPLVWRAASPHWTPNRHKMIAAKYKKALAGEQDKEFDDPDPMRGFESQFLNVWHLRERKQVGRPVVDSEVWRGMSATVPDFPPDVVAVEGWYDQGVCVAQAWDTDGGVVVSVADYPDVPAAAAAVATTGCRGQVLVGSSLAEHVAWETLGVVVEPESGSVRQVVAEFAQAIKESSFRHGRSGVLTEQALAMRVADGVDGVRVVSKERADAVKAATWAVRAAVNGYDALANVW